MNPESLTQWRTARKWTKARAARETRTSLNSWVKWEKGSPTPPWLGFVLRAVGDGQKPYE